ncbi:MAG: hypothetical protein JHC31_07315 [Sulfurihydrogenibium sp.]|nr:hypothetical protein [Sulfurihydrogenibium sp.]
MAKVRLIGEVKAEFEVKFGLNEDITIEVFKAEDDGTVVYYGKGDLEKASEKALSFIADRIKYFLEKNKKSVSVNEETLRKMYNRKVSPIYEIMHCKYAIEDEKRSCSLRPQKVNEVKRIQTLMYVAENKVFLINKDYMKLYLEILKKYEELRDREDICLI